MAGWGDLWGSMPWGGGVPQLTLVSPNLALAGGTVHLTTTRQHAGKELALASGTQTVTKSAPVLLNAPNMRLISGAASLTVVRHQVAGNLVFASGTFTFPSGTATA